MTGSGDGEVRGILQAHLLQVPKLHGTHGVVQPHTGFQPKTDAQGEMIS